MPRSIRGIYQGWSAALLCVLIGCSSGRGASSPDAGDAGDAVTDGGGGGGFGGGQRDGGRGTGSGDASAEEPPALPGVMALRIEPSTLELRDDGASPGEMGTLRAIGTFADGERDVSAQVVWSLDDPELCDLTDGDVTTRNVGGSATVIARALGVEGRAELTVRLEVAAQTDGAPEGIAELFAPSLDDDEEVPAGDDRLRIVYPSHETMFPRNLERVDHQWRADAALDRFELRFESDVALVRFYTGDKHYLPDLDGWRWLANTHAGRSLTLTVRGTSSADPSVIVRSQPITLYYSRSEVPGALYYWSTGAQGVLKATLSSPVATKFFTDPESDDTTCVSCHTVSRNGQRLSAGYGGERLRAIEVSDRSLLLPSMPEEQGVEYGWGTFSPDASRLLYASKGVLTMLDVDTGSSPFAVTLPTNGRANHPDWAPNGDFVAVAYSLAKMDNKSLGGTSLARIPVMSDGLGAPEVLLASASAEDTLFFPSYSPNSAWLAFVRSIGKSKDSVTATIALLPADGGEPVALTRLNERVGDEDGITGIGNSMPTWAPSTKPDIFWVAFSSLRAYGEVLPEGRDQLWAAAIDPAAIARGEDPSYAAFWMPFQDVNEGNHRAFWAIDTEVACPSTIEICDDLDNDCDGVVDEDCCTPSEELCDGEDNDCDGEQDEGCCIPEPEICGDEIDNDCDLAKDEGCGCSGIEVCGNSIDDDCDELVDEICVD